MECTKETWRRPPGFSTIQMLQWVTCFTVCMKKKRVWIFSKCQPYPSEQKLEEAVQEWGWYLWKCLCIFLHRQRAVQRGQRHMACWPTTLPSLPFSPSVCFILPVALWGSGTESKLRKNYGVGKSLIYALICQQEYLHLKWNCCCKVDLPTPVVVANSATSFSYESQSTLK